MIFIKAIILAGGEGKRLRPLTATRPKPLMRIGDRALLDIMLERLAQHDINEVAITLGYRGEDIIKEIGASLHSIKIKYYMEKEPLGTAGCVKNCEDFIDSDTLILSADALTDIDFSELIKKHEQCGGLATLSVTERKNAHLYGVVDFDENGRVTSFREKPELNEDVSVHVNCGIYVIKKEVLDFIPKNLCFDFAKDVFPLLLPSERGIFVYETDAFWCDIGSFAEYRRSNILTLSKEFFVKSISCVEQKGKISDSIIGQGSRILDKAVIKDSVVGRNTRIGSKTKLNSCILGDCVTVGENVNISAGAVVGDFAILGDGVNVGEGENIPPYTVYMG